MEIGPSASLVSIVLPRDYGDTLLVAGTPKLTEAGFGYEMNETGCPRHSPDGAQSVDARCQHVGRLTSWNELPILGHRTIAEVGTWLERK